MSGQCNGKEAAKNKIIQQFMTPGSDIHYLMTSIYEPKKYFSRGTFAISEFCMTVSITKKMKFTNESSVKTAKDFVELCVSKRKEGRSFYHIYPFHQFKYSYLDTLEFPDDMDFEEREAFKNIFRMFKPDKEHSMTTMVRLVSKIDEHCRKYRKDYY